MISFVELLRLIYNDQKIIGAYVIDRCKQLACSRVHERDTDGLSADPVAGIEKALSNRTRREVLEVLVGTGITAGAATTTTFLLSKVAASIDAIDGAIFGKDFDISSDFVTETELSRRTAFSRLAPVQNPHQAQLFDVVRKLNSGAKMNDDDEVFLKELAMSRSEPDVRGYAAQLLSTEYGRNGAMSEATQILNVHNDLIISNKSLEFSMLVQKSNLHFMSMPRYFAMSPEKWSVSLPLSEIRSKFGDMFSFSSEGYPTILDDVQLGEVIREFGAPFVHACFFFWYQFTASPRLIEAQRRDIWDYQLQFYRRCCQPSVVGSINVDRAVWNHFLLLALQAHRFKDFVYRDKFVAIAIGEHSEGPFERRILEAALSDRFHKLDHMYVMFALFLASLEMEDKQFRAPGTEKARLVHLIDQRAEIPNQGIRVALDTIRKFRQRGAISDEDAVRDYVARTGNFDCFIPEMVLPQ